jgi:hypothetical protein
MTKPLTRYEDWSTNMKLEFNHLKRRRVLVAHEIADERAVITHGLGSGTVRHACSLDDGGIIPHRVYESDRHLFYYVSSLYSRDQERALFIAYPWFKSFLNFFSILIARLVDGLGLFFFGLFFFLIVKKTFTPLNII